MLDSSVVISAFRSRLGASNRLLGLVEDGRLVPLATPALFLEYEDVLKRPEQRGASGLTLAEVDAALAALAALTEPVEVRFTWRPQLADPGEVTHNLADFAAAAPRFGLALLRPGELLERMGR